MRLLTLILVMVLVPVALLLAGPLLHRPPGAVVAAPADLYPTIAAWRSFGGAQIQSGSLVVFGGVVPNVLVRVIVTGDAIKESDELASYPAHGPRGRQRGLSRGLVGTSPSGSPGATRILRPFHTPSRVARLASALLSRRLAPAGCGGRGAALRRRSREGRIMPNTTTAPPGSGPSPTFTPFERVPFEPDKIRDAFIGVLSQPVEFWESVRENKGYGPPLVFAAVMGLACGGLGALLGQGLGHVVAAPIGCVAGSFIGGALLYAIAHLAGGRADYEASVRIAAYTSAVMPISAVLSLVPVLGMVAGLYGLYLGALGVIAIEGADRQKTFVAAAVLAVFFVLTPWLAYLAFRIGMR